ncbi:MAG: twin-arginine translocase TatA/TatE family subunit [Elusimicrobiota bacterium]
MLPNLGYGELLIILAVVILLFGAKQVPEIARAFGRAINSFKAGMKEPPEDVPKDPPQDDSKPGSTT